MTDQTKLIVRMAKKLDRIDWEITFRKMCPWLDIAETDRSRAKNLRQQLFHKLGVNNKTVTCWLTGLNCAVKVAHILPDSTKADVLKRLELDATFKNDTRNPRNFMILAETIEEAFDSMHISFCPKDVLNPTKLYLKVWSDELRGLAIGGDDDDEEVRNITFGSLEKSEAMLMVPEDWRVSLTSLSYHHLCCYIYHKSKGDKSLDPDMPSDFSSQGTKDKDNVRKALVNMLNTAKRFDQEEEEEEALNYSDFESKSNQSQEETLTSPPARRKFFAIL